jgi:hypothetical protein
MTEGPQGPFFISAGPHTPSVPAQAGTCGAACGGERTLDQPGFIVRANWNCYIHAMMLRRTPKGAFARKTMPQPIVLDDHARLPGRFFGRMTAAVLAGL